MAARVPRRATLSGMRVCRWSWASPRPSRRCCKTACAPAWCSRPTASSWTAPMLPSPACWAPRSLALRPCRSSPWAASCSATASRIPARPASPRKTAACAVASAVSPSMLSTLCSLLPNSCARSWRAWASAPSTRWSAIPSACARSRSRATARQTCSICRPCWRARPASSVPIFRAPTVATSCRRWLRTASSTRRSIPRCLCPIRPMPVRTCVRFASAPISPTSTVAWAPSWATR